MIELNEWKKIQYVKKDRYKGVEKNKTVSVKKDRHSFIKILKSMRRPR
jgi:hypothetical protein